MKTWILVAALLLSNLLWYRAYRALDLDDMQANAMLDWAHDYMAGAK